MTAKERARLRRIEIENAELRKKIDQHISVYRDQAIEIIELRATIDMIREFLAESAQP